jgi:lysozyme
MELDKNLLDSVKFHEGFRTRAYQDTVGVWTIGYGTNLQALVVDEPTAARWLHDKLVEAQSFAKGLPEWNGLSPVRRNVVIEMIYNLGPRGYVMFANTRRAMQDGRYADAAKGMLASKWALQVGQRALRLAQQMEKGEAWQDLAAS